MAVLINKAMIEIPPKFAGKPPVNPEARKEKSLIAREWKGAQGLAEDVRYYGQWMRDEAEKRIGHLYPKVEITAEMAKERPDLKQYVGQKLTVIAWLWARTVKSPNPAFANVDVPLASTFMLSTKAGKEAYVEPVIEGGGYRFTVKVGKPKDAEAAKNGTKLSRGANFQVPDVGNADRVRLHQGRGQGRTHGCAADGDRRRGRSRTRLSRADAGAWRRSRSRRSRSGSRKSTMPENPRWFSPPLYGLNDLRRPLHPPPARGADDLLRPGAGSARAGEARRPRRRPARRRQAPRATAALARRRTPMRWGCIWRLRLSRLPIMAQRSVSWDAASRRDVASTFRSAGDSDDLGFRGSKSVLRASAAISDQLVDMSREVH